MLPGRHEGRCQIEAISGHPKTSLNWDVRGGMTSTSHPQIMRLSVDLIRYPLPFLGLTNSPYIFINFQNLTFSAGILQELYKL